MSDPADPPALPHWHDLRERDRSIIQLLLQEHITEFSFEGLKHRLSIHPETLSRALSRLEAQQLIHKDPFGYRVTPPPMPFLPIGRPPETPTAIPLGQTLIPPDIPVEDLITTLRGRWFGDLRWWGRANHQNTVILKWITSDGGLQVDAEFTATAATFTAYLHQDQPVATAINASYHLLGFIARFYSHPTTIDQADFSPSTPISILFI